MLDKGRVSSITPHVEGFLLKIITIKGRIAR
jgi:hypothetical protein